MAKTTIVLNNSQIRDFLRSEDMKNMITERAEAIVARCGENYKAIVYRGKFRYKAKIQNRNWQGYKDNKKNNTILKAVR